MSEFADKYQIRSLKKNNLQKMEKFLEKSIDKSKKVCYSKLNKRQEAFEIQKTNEEDREEGGTVQCPE